MTENHLGPRFQDALVFAFHVHEGDVRKGTAIPYVSHLLAVCALVLEDGGDEDEAIAALLHDTLEDHPEEADRTDLEDRFGARVADLVERCSDTPSDYVGGPKPPWAERKAAYVERIRKEGYPDCRVSLADKLHNVRCMAADHARLGDALWSRFNATREQQLAHQKALTAAFSEAGAPEHLVDELAALVRRLESSDVT